MAIEDLSQRLTSNIPTPVAQHGYAIQQPEIKTVVYDGQPLPKFLLDHGANPSNYPEFLRLNQIGAVFEELKPGLVVKIPDPDQFPTHPEA